MLMNAMGKYNLALYSLQGALTKLSLLRKDILELLESFSENISAVLISKRKSKSNARNY